MCLEDAVRVEVALGDDLDVRFESIRNDSLVYYRQVGTTSGDGEPQFELTGVLFNRPGDNCALYTYILAID